jgi:hypothetical protein
MKTYEPMGLYSPLPIRLTEGLVKCKQELPTNVNSHRPIHDKENWEDAGYVRHPGATAVVGLGKVPVKTKTYC